MTRVFIAVLSFLSLAPSAYSQWQIVARNILGTTVPIPYAGGVITYQANRVWAGDRYLWYSDDQGVTWQRSTLSIDSAYQRITDVAFFDRLHGVVSTFGALGWAKVYQTSDAGATWTGIDSIKDNGYVSIAYGRTASDITATGAATRITHNGGQTWVNGNSSDLFVVRQGVRLLTILPGTPSASHVGESFDDGLSWTPGAGIIPLDCYSLALDSCDPNFLVLANENYFYSNPPISNIFITTDGGATWSASLTSTQVTNRLTGATARGKRAIYCTTLRDGVLQSIDHGQTWRDISGPSGSADSRDICCITDNLLLVCDQYGSIWRTTNAGGYPVAIPDPANYRLEPRRLFATDTLSACDSSVIRIARVFSTACERRENSGEQILGPDSAHFRIIRGLPRYPTGYDSVIISFRADSARPYIACYVVKRGQGLDTIYLSGNGRAPLRTIAPDVKLLAFDTIRACDAARKTLWLHSSSCTPWKVQSVAIMGRDSAHFLILRQAPFVLTGLDSVRVSFAPDSARYYGATLHVVLDDGTSFDVPIEGIGAATPTAIVQSRLTLFDTVRRSACEQAIDSLWINDTACLTHSILRTRVIGVDSLYYSASLSSAGNLPDTITAIFTPDSVRDYHATLEVLLSDSSMVTVQLLGTGVKVQHAFAMPDVTRFADSLSLCDTTAVRWLIFHDTACHWRSSPIIALSDSSHFSLEAARRSSNAAVDSFLVRFHGDSAGAYTATLVVMYDDTTITVPLTGYGKTTERSLSVKMTELFTHDTVSPCGLPLLQYVAIADSSCLPWYVTGYRWSGADSTYYTLIRKLPSPLTGRDTLAVLFSPDAPRRYFAGLTVTLSDGREIAFTLAGDGAPYTKVALTTSARLSTTIVGDVVRVPIYLSHSAPIPTVRFAVHYDTTLLRFLDAGQMHLDGFAATGNFHVRIDSTASADSLVGYLDFQIFPRTDSCGDVRLDSLQFESEATRVCAIITSDSAVSRICGPFDCTTPIFSDFLRYSRMPAISVSPNPTTSEILVQSDVPLGVTSVTVYSELGVTVVTRLSELSPASPTLLSLAGLPRGTYYLTVLTMGGYRKSFTLVKE